MNALGRTPCVPLILAALAFVWLASPELAAARSAEADVAYERGTHALREGDVQGALDFLARAAELESRDSAILEAYVRALLQAGELERAETAAQSWRAEEDSAAVELLLGTIQLRREKWSEAREHLEAAAQRDPENAQAQLFLGVVCQELGDFAAARTALEAARRLDPSLEGAVAYRMGLVALRQRDRESARRFLEEAQRLQPGSPLADSAAQYLLRLEEKQDKRWEVFSTAGLVFDSNVNLVGEGDAIQLSRERDVRAVLEVGGSAFVWDAEPFRLQVGNSTFLSRHQHERDFDVLSTNSWALGSYRLSESVQVDLQYAAEWDWADFHSFRRSHSVEPALRLALWEGGLTRLFYRQEDRDYFVRDSLPELDRDGQLRTLGADQYFILPLHGALEGSFARLGYRFQRESTHGDNFDSHGNALVASLGIPLPQRLLLLLDGYYERRHYAKESVLDPARGPRDDHVRQLRLALQRSFGEHVEVEASWRRVNWSSNVPDFDYHRSIVSLLATYRY